jgi:hypothetical protein
MLSEQRRQQLDGIVHQMIQSKESDSNIQFVVDDFKLYLYCFGFFLDGFINDGRNSGGFMENINDVHRSRDIGEGFVVFFF